MRTRRCRKVDFHFRIVIKFKPRMDDGIMLIFHETNLNIHVLGGSGVDGNGCGSSSCS
jgi:hypothetical protein